MSPPDAEKRPSNWPIDHPLRPDWPVCEVARPRCSAPRTRPGRRARQVLEALRGGLSTTPEIAARLGTSTATINHHLGQLARSRRVRRAGQRGRSTVWRIVECGGGVG